MDQICDCTPISNTSVDTIKMSTCTPPVTDYSFENLSVNVLVSTTSWDELIQRTAVVINYERSGPADSPPPVVPLWSHWNLNILKLLKNFVLNY